MTTQYSNLTAAQKTKAADLTAKRWGYQSTIRTQNPDGSVTETANTETKTQFVLRRAGELITESALDQKRQDNVAAQQVLTENDL